MVGLPADGQVLGLRAGFEHGADSVVGRLRFLLAEGGRVDATQANELPSLSQANVPTSWRTTPKPGPVTVMPIPATVSETVDGSPATPYGKP